MANAQTTLLLPLVNDPTAPMYLRASKTPIPEDAQDLDVAAIVECDFLGYAPQLLNDFAECDTDLGNVGEALTDVHSFQADIALVTAQTIYFLYVTKEPVAAAAQLMLVVPLPVPIEMCAQGQMASFQVRTRCAGLS